MPKRTLWQLVSIALWLVACQPLNRPAIPLNQAIPFECDSILATPVAHLQAKKVERNELLELIEKSYGIEQLQMDVRILKEEFPTWAGGDKWDVWWTKHPLDYQLYVEEDSTISTIRIAFQSYGTVEKIVSCIGEDPDFYVAKYMFRQPVEMAPYYESTLDIIFPKLGIVVATVQQRNSDPFTPSVQKNELISGFITYSNPGPPSDVYNRSLGIHNGTKVAPEPLIWPGSWDEIQFTDMTAQ